MKRSANPLVEAHACLCFALRKASRSASRRYDAALRPSGLRSTQFNLLVVLDATGTIASGALADRVGIERTTLTRNLAVLLRSGLISVAPGTDRRSRQVRITARGRRAAIRAMPAWRRAQAAITAELGADVVELAGRLAARRTTT